MITTLYRHLTGAMGWRPWLSLWLRWLSEQTRLERRMVTRPGSSNSNFWSGNFGIRYDTTRISEEDMARASLHYDQEHSFSSKLPSSTHSPSLFTRPYPSPVLLRRSTPRSLINIPRSQSCFTYHFGFAQCFKVSSRTGVESCTNLWYICSEVIP